jgi:hypothetical protein
MDERHHLKLTKLNTAEVMVRGRFAENFSTALRGSQFRRWLYKKIKAIVFSITLLPQFEFPTLVGICRLPL